MPKQVRVLHIVHALGYGGMESRIARLARGLPEHGYHVSVLSLKQPNTGALELPQGTPHQIYPMPSGLHMMHLFRLVRLVRGGNYDIVHTHNWSSMFYGILAARLARVPVVVHGEHGLNREDLKGVPWKRLWTQRLLSRCVTQLVPVNEVIAAHVQRFWRRGPQHMTVIPNGVDLRRFQPARKSPAGESETFTLGMVGRLDAVKDIRCAIEALALLAQKGPGKWRLILVGDGPLRQELETVAKSLGVGPSVEFAGARADVETWYPKFDLYLNTSVYEGMCNTLLEAMACRLPLVASRVPGNVAWLRETENAAFFTPGDSRDLAEAIHQVRLNPMARDQMADRNRNRVESEFDNQGFIKAYLNLYRRFR
jgi:L-malate glycosyltransferase